MKKRSSPAPFYPDLFFVSGTYCRITKGQIITCINRAPLRTPRLFPSGVASPIPDTQPTQDENRLLFKEWKEVCHCLGWEQSRDPPRAEQCWANWELTPTNASQKPPHALWDSIRAGKVWTHGETKEKHWNNSWRMEGSDSVFIFRQNVITLWI